MMGQTRHDAWNAGLAPPPASRPDAAAGELRIVFLYLGRGGALGTFAQSLAGSAGQAQGVAASFVVSQMNPCLEALRREAATLALPTFEPGSAIATARNFLAARRMLHAHFSALRPHAVVVQPGSGGNDHGNGHGNEKGRGLKAEHGQGNATHGNEGQGDHGNGKQGAHGKSSSGHDNGGANSNKGGNKGHGHGKG